MKKVYRLLAVVLSLMMIMSLTACGGKKDKTTTVEDYYEFDVSSIRTEILIGETLTLNPVIRNLGEVVPDAKYGVTVTLNGADVTSSAYTAATKVFNPQEAGDYSVTFTVQDENGKDKVQNGEKFTKTVTISVVAMTFVNRDTAVEPEDVTIDDSDPSDATITFGDTYLTKTSTSNQFGISGVTFQGNYKLVYKLDIKGFNPDYPDVIGPCILFGVDRDDGDDDNIYVKMDDGKVGCWFWAHNGTVPGGDEWTGSGWMSSKNKVPNAPITGKHTVGFTRVIGLEEEDPPAYYIIEFDGQYVTTLNIGLNYSEVLSAVWIESFGVAATVGIESFRSLPRTAAAPVITAEYEPMLAGEAFDLTSGVTFTESWGCPAVAKMSFEVTDPNGNAVTVANNKITPQVKGDYTVKVTVADVLGVSSTITATASTSASFSFNEFNVEQKVNQEITIGTSYLLAGDAEKQSVELKLLKGNTAVSGVQFTRTGDNFKFTVAEGGRYTIQATMTLTSGATVVKTQELWVADTAAASQPTISFTGMTTTARTGLGHIVYYSVKDTDNSDKTAMARVSVLKGETEATATDASAMLTDVVSTTTENNHLTFKVFRPTEAGKYFVRVYYVNANGAAKESFHAITVADNTTAVYDGYLGTNDAYDYANMTVGKEGTAIFNHQDGAAESYHYNVYDTEAPLSYPALEGSWVMTFKLTDFWVVKTSAAGVAALITYSNPNGTVTEATETSPASDTRTGTDKLMVAGQKGNDLWGFQGTTIGLGAINYEWRGVWQNKTDEFCPLDADGKPIPFREAPGYTQYATGTHEYRIEFHAAEEVTIKDAEGNTTTETRAVYYYFIDGRPEARHVLTADHNNYTTVSRIQIVGYGVRAILTDCTFGPLNAAE